jgi:hypothetical protein
MKHHRLLVSRGNILFDLFDELYLDQTANITMKKVEKNETLLTEIPIERIDKSLNRFRFQVSE